MQAVAIKAFSIFSKLFLTVFGMRPGEYLEDDVIKAYMKIGVDCQSLRRIYRNCNFKPQTRLFPFKNGGFRRKVPL